jgi:hypothetical protein
MKVTPSTILLPILALAVGLLLIGLGFGAGIGLVWAAAGGFLVAVALSAMLLTLAWVLPEPWATVLRHRAVGITILLAVLSLLILTVVLGFLGL